jgi:Phosphotransferase enzyme family
VAGPAQVGHAAEAWLCMLPADARRFRVSDPRLAAALGASGGELVDTAPDVEIADRPEELQGDAAVAVVSLGRPGWASGSPAARVAKRSRASARVRLDALAAHRALRRLGYTLTEAALWDVGHAFARMGSPGRRSPVEYLPQCALVFGRREPPGRSLLDAALADAGAGPVPRRLSARGGPMLAFTDRGLLRVAVGPGRRQLRGQVEALEALHAHGLSDTVGHRVPWPITSGTSGLAEWTLEPLLPGAAPSGPLPGECIDFLVAMHSVGDASPTSLHASAGVVAQASAATAGQVMELAMRLDAELAGVPRGFGHGDFFAGNLLVEGSRLTGVIDWDSAGPGRLPLLDVLQLVMTSRFRPSATEWGAAVLGELMPWARRSGDAAARDYCARVGLEPDPRLLERLVAAYWLDRAASQLATHAERWEDREWIAANVEFVARSLRLPT